MSVCLKIRFWYLRFPCYDSEAALLTQLLVSKASVGVRTADTGLISGSQMVALIQHMLTVWEMQS